MPCVTLTMLQCLCGCVCGGETMCVFVWVCARMYMCVCGFVDVCASMSGTHFTFIFKSLPIYCQDSVLDDTMVAEVGLSTYWWPSNLISQFRFQFRTLSVSVYISANFPGQHKFVVMILLRVELQFCEIFFLPLQFRN